MWRNVTKRHAAVAKKKKTRVFGNTVHFDHAAANQLNTATLNDLGEVLKRNKHHNDRLGSFKNKKKQSQVAFHSATSTHQVTLLAERLNEVIERSNLERGVIFNSSQDRLASLKLLDHVNQPLLAQIAWSNAAFDRETGETVFYEAAIRHLNETWLKASTQSLMLFALNYVRHWHNSGRSGSVLEHVEETLLNGFIQSNDSHFRHRATRIILNSCLDNGQVDEAVALATQMLPESVSIDKWKEEKYALFDILDFIKFNGAEVTLSPFALGFLQREEVAAAGELRIEYEHPWLSDLLEAKLDEFEKLIAMFDIDQERALLIVDLLVKRGEWDKLDCFISAGHILKTHTAGGEWKLNLAQPQLVSNLTIAAPHLGDSINTLLTYSKRQRASMANLVSILAPDASKTPQILARALCGAEASVERMVEALELNEKEATTLVRVLPGCRPFFDKMTASNEMLNESINFASLYASVNQQLVNQQQIGHSPLDVYNIQVSGCQFIFVKTYKKQPLSNKHEGAWSLERILECTAEYNSLDSIVNRRPLKANPLKLARRLTQDTDVWNSSNDDFKIIASEFLQNTIASMDGIRDKPAMWILTTDLQCLIAQDNGANLWPRLNNDAKKSLANNRSFLTRLNELDEMVKNEIKTELNVMHPIDYILKVLMKSTKLSEDNIAEIMDHFDKESASLQIPAQNTSRALKLLKEIKFINGTFSRLSHENSELI